MSEKSTLRFKQEMCEAYAKFYLRNPKTVFSRDRLMFYLRELMYKYCPSNDYSYAESCILDIMKLFN